ncbi:MAG TPA: hypothetical protein VMM76_03390 [Pirellulaceae bacterium]|nr:hypothetical protein [Pirellulaceae bacterium]
MKMNRESILIALCVLSCSLTGCSSPAEVATDEVSRAVYVDTKTLKAMVCDVVADPPAMNPVTGTRTLMPALYCPSCLRWHNLPPLDQINRTPNATKCGKTGATLTADGPWPE